MNRRERRRARARILSERTPHARELLAFLARLLDSQEPVYQGARSAAWLTSLVDSERDPWLQWDRLPTDALGPHVPGFARTIGLDAPAPIQAACETLKWLDPAAATQQLGAWVEGSDADTETLPARDFVGRVFLQAVAEAVAEAVTGPAGEHRRRCIVCGALPVVSCLRDDAERKGARWLVCAFCHSEWGFPRATCAGCGSEDRDQLVSYEAESMPHVSLNACTVCRRYLKRIDLRKDGLADPVADDLATVDLDLWASDQGLTRLQPNLLGV